MQLVKFYSYFLGIIPLISLFNLLFSGNPKSLIPAIIPILVAYFTISGLKKGKPKHVKVGGIYYGFLALFMIFLAFAFYSINENLGGPLFFIGCSIFCGYGCYVLFLNKVVLREFNEITSGSAEDDYNLKSFDYTYNGYDIYKSPKYYWYEKKYFNKAKEIEAYIEDLIADSDNSKII